MKLIVEHSQIKMVVKMVVTLFLLAFGLAHARYPIFPTPYAPPSNRIVKTSVNQFPGFTPPFYPPGHKKHPPSPEHLAKNAKISIN
ncbi:hypothetical protein AtNW77_Chr2g0237681 [Arabidopsis thaliana]